ncbi:MAG: hypothetical protein WC223_05140 [Bacteroidales bacterium]|jgi:uncharacterized protein YpuA (DUF1002 family)
MKTIEECRKILGVSVKEYTDEQLESIINFLYKIAGTNIEYIKQQLKKQKLKKDKENE